MYWNQSLALWIDLRKFKVYLHIDFHNWDGTHLKSILIADKEPIFLQAKPWISGYDKSIFMVHIHYWRSPLRQFARARTIDEYNVTMPVSRIRMTSQINCDDVTVLI